MKVVAGIILTFLLGAMFLGLFAMSAGMSMSVMDSDCPFMSHEETLCPMSLAEHLGAWQSVFLAVLPTTLMLFIAAGVVTFVLTVAPHLISERCKPIPIHYRQLRERTYTFTHRSLQELFSQGILNPKLF